MATTSKDACGKHKLLQHSKQRALMCLHEKEFGRALAHLFITFTLQPSSKQELLTSFLFALGKHCEMLQKREKWDEVFHCYEQALQIFPHNQHILHGLGSILFRLGYVEKAAVYFQRACQEDPFFTPSLCSVDNIRSSLIERWHFAMLNDKNRNMSYLQAIGRTVKSGYKQVLDIGAGTGILSMMAADAGAELVYACEGNQIMFRIMKDVIEANGKNESLILIQKFSTDLSIPEDIPERISLIVTETFDAGLFGEHILFTLQHAWNHLLFPCSNIKESDIEEALTDILVDQYSSSFQVSSSEENYLSDCDILKGGTSNSQSSVNKGRVIPKCATLWGVPAECDRMRKCMRLDNSVLDMLGLLNFLVIPPISDEEPYTTEHLANLPGSYKYLSEPCIIMKIDFNNPQDIAKHLQGITANSKFRCIRNGQIDIFVVWFHLHLDDETMISTDPESEAMCWEQAVFYILPQHLQGTSPIIHEGDIISVSILCKGHLILQKVETSRCEEKIEICEYMCIDSATIYQLNSLVASGIFAEKCWIADTLQNRFSVIDFSSFPLLGLMALKYGAEKLVVLETKYKKEITVLVSKCNISQKKISFVPSENLCDSSTKYDLLIIDPIKVCGMLKEQILEDIALLSTSCLKESALVIPGKLSLYAVLLDSTCLIQQTKLVAEEQTMGYKITPFINFYQTRVHQDIELTTLPHQKLSGDIKLCEIDFNDRSARNSPPYFDMHGVVETKLTRTGNISAILYWFILMYSPDCIVNTSEANSLMKQAAIVPREEISVIKGNVAVLEWTCKNSCLYIAVKEVR